ncbi:hypothetical protein ACULNC_03120 [Shigella flexneri]
MSEEDTLSRSSMCACFCLAKMIRCLRNSLAVWKLPARIWSLLEEAACIRDQIQAVRRVTEKQFVSNTGDEPDVIGVAFDAGMALCPRIVHSSGKVLAAAAISRKCLAVRN